MSGRKYKDNFYFLVNFIAGNHKNETTSFEGIPVTCEANDDFAYQRGDINEPMLAAALYYINNNRCP